MHENVTTERPGPGHSPSPGQAVETTRNKKPDNPHKSTYTNNHRARSGLSKARKRAQHKGKR